MSESHAQSIGHRGHSEFIGFGKRLTRVVDTDELESQLFDFDSHLQQVRRPGRPVSAPPVVGIEGWEQVNQETPPMPVAVPGTSPVPPNPAPSTRFIPDTQQAMRQDKSTIMRETFSRYNLSLHQYDHLERLVENGTIVDVEHAVHHANL